MSQMKRLSKDMKKIMLIIDILLIVITTILLFYYNYSDSYGLEALESVGKFVVCLFSLGIEIIILIILAILWLYSKLRSKR